MNIKKYLESKKIKLKEISEACDIPYTTLLKSVKTPETMKLMNFEKIAEYLGVTMDELYNILCTAESPILTALTQQRKAKLSGNLYHYTQIQFAYNSNRIEGSRLTEEETRLLYETKTLLESKSTSIDDLFETANHFRMFDLMLDEIEKPLTEEMIKRYHGILMNGTSNSDLEWFNTGEYKSLANEVGGTETSSPEDVPGDMRKLLLWYLSIKKKKFEDIVEFHYRFEKIHPFQDGNGRVGRMIMFRECLKNNVVPFIITDDYKAFYYRGLAEFRNEPGYLTDTCLTMQDNYKKVCKRFINFTE